MGTEVASPIIQAEMADWVKLGGRNSGIKGDGDHPNGFHRGANRVPSDDYSRRRDPNGSDGPYTDWDWCCAGDFSHRNDPRLRRMHLTVFTRLMDGELPMICEFIGRPFTSGRWDDIVIYWSRWNGSRTIKRYTGSGHDHWSHISWWRSRANQRAYLWRPEPAKVILPAKPAPPKAKQPYLTDDQTRSIIMALPVIQAPGKKNPTTAGAVLRLQGLLNTVWGQKLDPDGEPGPATTAAINNFKRAVNARVPNAGLSINGRMEAKDWSFLIAGRNVIR